MAIKRNTANLAHGVKTTELTISVNRSPENLPQTFTFKIRFFSIKSISRGIKDKSIHNSYLPLQQNIQSEKACENRNSRRALSTLSLYSKVFSFNQINNSNNSSKSKEEIVTPRTAMFTPFMSLQNNAVGTATSKDTVRRILNTQDGSEFTIPRSGYI